MIGAYLSKKKKKKKEERKVNAHTKAGSQQRKQTDTIRFTMHTPKEFLRGPLAEKNDPVKEYILYGGWAPSMIKHYNAGVTKLTFFAQTFKIPRSAILPIDAETLYQFVLWAGPRLPGDPTGEKHAPVKADTIRTYLAGIKAWHLYHDQQYPHEATPRVELILTTAKKLDLLKGAKVQKDPVLVKHLFMLLETLIGGTLEDQTVYTVALVAFWGMARLGEFLKGPKSANFVRVKDVVWDPTGESCVIRIREAKTAAVGEVQEIYLKRQDSLLDPVSALRRLLQCTGSTEDEALFSYVIAGQRRLLTKGRSQAVFSRVWKAKSDNKLTGHSFRVGGASLRWNLGVPLGDIVAIGRWRSKAYKFYIRQYSDDEMKDCCELLSKLRLT